MNIPTVYCNIAYKGNAWVISLEGWNLWNWPNIWIYDEIPWLTGKSYCWDKKVKAWLVYCKMCSIHQSASFPDLPRAMSSCLLSHFLCLVSEVIWSWMQHGLKTNNLWFVLNPVLHKYFQFSFLWNLLKTPLLVGLQCKFNHRGRAQDSKLACPICGWDSTLFQKKKKIFLCHVILVELVYTLEICQKKLHDPIFRRKNFTHWKRVNRECFPQR